MLFVYLLRYCRRRSNRSSSSSSHCSSVSQSPPRRRRHSYSSSRSGSWSRSRSRSVSAERRAQQSRRLYRYVIRSRAHLATYYHLDLQKLLTPSCLPQTLIYAWLWSECKDKCGNGEEIQTESNCKFLWYQRKLVVF